MSKVAMIGCGAWGMALACHLSRSGHDVTVWCHSEEAAAKLTAERKMEAAFPGIQFPENIVFTHDAELAATGRDLIVFSVASSFTRSTAKLFAPFIPEGQKVVTVTKGIENETFKLQTEIIESEIPGITCAALSGPTHAEEVIRDMPTAIVAAAADRETAEFVQDIFISPFFRVYTSPDVRGVELGGSLKNVIALAAGMADGMGFGDNCKAALMTRGISHRHLRQRPLAEPPVRRADRPRHDAAGGHPGGRPGRRGLLLREGSGGPCEEVRHVDADHGGGQPGSLRGTRSEGGRDGAHAAWSEDGGGVPGGEAS